MDFIKNQYPCFSFSTLAHLIPSSSNISFYRDI